MDDQPPPSYEQAIGGSSTQPASSSTLQVPSNNNGRNGIPAASRRSMEDEARPLPTGWIRCFDHQYSHQYFVDTTKNPPRSIWRHPYDDQTYIDSLPSAERERLSSQGLLHPHGPTRNDPDYESTDDEAASHGEGRAEPTNVRGKSALAKLGSKVKGHLEDREARRRERAAQEEEAHRSYTLFRQGLEAATRTGKPHLLGVDDEGRELYLQPPGAIYPRAVRENRLSPYVTEVIYDRNGGPQMGKPGARFVRADGIYEGGASLEDDMLSNPASYGDTGRYQDPYGGGPQFNEPGMGMNHLNRPQFPGAYGYGAMNRFGRPRSPYARPGGFNYGGGRGLPLAFPLFGGLMLGGLLF